MHACARSLARSLARTRMLMWMRMGRRERVCNHVQYMHPHVCTLTQPLEVAHSESHQHNCGPAGDPVTALFAPCDPSRPDTHHPSRPDTHHPSRPDSPDPTRNARHSKSVAPRRLLSTFLSVVGPIFEVDGLGTRKRLAKLVQTLRILPGTARGQAQKL